MAQYQIYNTGTYIEYSDGVNTYRIGSRSNKLVTDKELYLGGFNDLEGIGWINREEKIHALSTGVWRDGVRDTMFCIDTELNVMGFDGIKSTDNGLTGDWLEYETNNVP